MVAATAAALALLALAAPASAEWEDPFQKAAEAKVDPSHWINKACSGQSVRFSIQGTKTDAALNEFGTAMRLPTPKLPTGKSVPRRVKGFQMAAGHDVYGMSPAKPHAHASWDYSNDNPKKGAACRSKLKRYVRRYGNRLQFSNTPSGFAALFNAKKPFHKTVAKRMRQLGKSEIAVNHRSRATHYDGSGSPAAATTAAATGNWFTRLFGGFGSNQDRVRQARALPRAQPPAGQRSLRSRSVPNPVVAAPRKSYGEEIMDWGRGKIASGSRAINFHLSRIKNWVVSTSSTGGHYVSEQIANQLVAWAKVFGKKIRVNSASRKNGANYSDVHATHRRGETDLHVAGARDAARLIGSGIQSGARIDHVGYTYRTALISAARQIYGPTSAVYRRIASQGFIRGWKKHTTHAHIAWG